MRGRASAAAMVQYMGNPLHTTLGVKLLRLLGAAAVAQPAANLTGQVALVTGGTGGIGRSIARSLVLLGAEVHVTGRDATSGARVAEEDGVRFHQVDHSDLAATRAFASRVLAQCPCIDILVNNAAAMHNGFGRTREGHERSVALNLLGCHALTTALLPRIDASPAGGRVLTVVSAGMFLYRLDVAELRDLDDGVEPWSAPGGYDAIKAYCLTHRGRVLLTRHWGAEAEARGSRVQFASVHPGWVDTPGLATADAMAAFYRLTRPVLRTAEEGADTVVWLAATLQAAEPARAENGGYYFDRAPRPIDMRLAGTAATQGDVVKLLEFCTARAAPSQKSSEQQ